MTRDPNATYWAIKRRARAAANAPAEPAKVPTKAELIEQAEAAGIEVKANQTKAEIAAALEAGE